MPPTTTFLISDHKPFKVCPVTHRTTPVEPILDIYTLSQPDPKVKNLRLRWPREIVDKVLDCIIIGHLESKEFGDAVMLAFIDKTVLRRWFRKCIKPNAHFCNDNLGVAAHQLSKFFYFLLVVFDFAYDFPVFPSVYDSEDEDEMERFELPVITLKHPYGLSIDGVIKPHHLVCPVRGSGWGVHYCISPNPFPQFADFKNPAVLAWTGNRVCDALVMDARVKDGFYHAEKVIHPILVLRIDTELEKASAEWEGARWQWKRFAELAHIAYEGAQVYMMGKGNVCYKL